MRMKVRGLNLPNERKSLLEGPYLARVVRFEPAGHAAKPCRAATFLVLDPGPYSGRYIRTRLYCHDRALWKLRWFLRDFGYDQDLLVAEELDDRQVIGLEGVIRLGFWGNNGQQHLDVQGFAPKEEWVELVERIGAESPAAAEAEA